MKESTLNLNPLPANSAMKRSCFRMSSTTTKQVHIHKKNNSNANCVTRGSASSEKWKYTRNEFTKFHRIKRLWGNQSVVKQFQRSRRLQAEPFSSKDYYNVYFVAKSSLKTMPCLNILEPTPTEVLLPPIIQTTHLSTKASRITLSRVQLLKMKNLFSVLFVDKP